MISVHIKVGINNTHDMGMFYMGTNDQIMQGGRKSFTNAFSSNLNTVNLRIFPAMVGGTLENKSLPVYRIMEDLSLRLVVKRFQRLSEVQFPSR